MMFVRIANFKGKFNLSNAHYTIESRTSVQKFPLCSLGIQHADYMRNLNN